MFFSFLLLRFDFFLYDYILYLAVCIVLHLLIVYHYESLRQQASPSNELKVYVRRMNLGVTKSKEFNDQLSDILGQ